jgi:hypothetical protein
MQCKEDLDHLNNSPSVAAALTATEQGLRFNLSYGSYYITNLLLQVRRGTGEIGTSNAEVEASRVEHVSDLLLGIVRCEKAGENAER